MKNLIRCYATLLIFIVSTTVLSADEFKIPTIAEFNALMLNAIKASKDQLWRSKIDEFTTLNFIMVVSRI